MLGRGALTPEEERLTDILSSLTVGDLLGLFPYLQELMEKYGG